MCQAKPESEKNQQTVILKQLRASGTPVPLAR
jgi:hypothetical protein